MSERLFRKILVPIDLHDPSIAALHYAGVIARRFGSEVTLMYADEVASLFGAYDTEFLAYHIESSKELQREETALRGLAEKYLPGGAEPSIVVIPGYPVASIVRVAAEENADLIVLGSRERGGLRRILAGSIVEGVIRAASQPVLVAPALPQNGAKPERIARVVCPVNFTDTAHEALEMACSVANAFASELLLVHVQERAGFDAQSVRDGFRACLSDEQRRQCVVHEMVLHGGPADRIVHCIEEAGADLLVIGAQVKSLRTDTVLGTTAERLLRLSPVPVLAVRRRTDTAEQKEHAEEAFAE
ncbi:MAG TPA: universal stress protein [Thermoanaerobaculia bacterium]